MGKRRRISLFLILILLVFFYGVKVNGQTQKKYAVATSVLKVLSSPSPDSSVVYIAQPGEKMDIIDDLGLWLKVKTQNGAVGFVQSNLVKIEVVIQAAPPSPPPSQAKSAPASSSGVQPVVSKRHHKIWPYLLGGAVVAGGAAYFLLSKKSSGGAEQKATLKISSSPAEGTVYVDGQEKGETPCTIEVSAGEHEIKVKRELYGEWSERMNLSAGQEYTIQAKLAPYKYEFDFCFGGYGAANNKFLYPIDVYVNKEGKIYVTDPFAGQIKVFNSSGGFLSKKSYGHMPFSIEYMSSNKRFYVVGYPVNGDYSVIFPIDASLNWYWLKIISDQTYGLGIDQDSKTLYGAAYYTNKIIKMDANGAVKAKWSVSGNPVWVAVGVNGEIYVTLHEGNKVAIYSSSGKKQGEFSRTVRKPAGITVDRMGHVYVTSSNFEEQTPAFDEIYKFLPDGKYVLKFGQHGSGNGQLRGVVGISISEEGDIYVADEFNSRVCKWRLSAQTASQASALITSKRKVGKVGGFKRDSRKVKWHFGDFHKGKSLRKLRK